MDRVLVPAFGVLAVILVFAIPTLRFFRRARRLPMSTEMPGAARRMMSFGLIGCCAGYAAFFATYAAAGPEMLGVRAAPRAVHAAGWALALLGVAIVALAQAQMGHSWRMGIVPERTALVMHGLFRYVRNPIFSGMLATLLGLVGVAPSWWTAIGFLLVGGLLSCETRMEEAHLATLHGEPYERYAARVGRFLPGVGRRSPARAQDGAAPVSRT